MQLEKTHGRDILKMISISILLLIILVPFTTSSGQSSSSGIQNDIAEEFKSTDGKLAKFETAQDQYHQVINCYFNIATQKVIEMANKQYKEDTGDESLIETPPKEKLKCDIFDSGMGGLEIAKVYKGKLEALLAKIYEDPNKRAQESDISESDKVNIKTCDLELNDTRQESENQQSNKWNIGYPAGNGKYFEAEEKDINSPVYAVFLVSDCYYLVYKEYLDRWGKQPYNVPTFAEEKGKTTMSSEDISTELMTRFKLIEEEANKAQRALDLALMSLQEFIESYPMHTRYAAIIKYSEAFREHMSRIRITTDQLQYKLPNLSTQSD